MEYMGSTLPTQREPYLAAMILQSWLSLLFMLRGANSWLDETTLGTAERPPLVADACDGASNKVASKAKTVTPLAFMTPP